MGPVLATPPDAPITATSEGQDHEPPDISDSGEDRDGPLLPVAGVALPVQHGLTDSPLAEPPPDDGSVRRRGLEAPVVLQQAAPEPEPADAVPDPGDGPVGRGGSQRPPRPEQGDKRKRDDRAENPARVWPMPPQSYTFSQAFGCVPQLGNLYFANEHCPHDAPVVHTGIDLAAPEGTPFYAAASGWVTLAGYDRPTPDANTRIIIQHDGKNDGFATEYLHWVATFVDVGDYVRAGQPIGEVGNVGYSTGPHLHFSVVDLASGEHIDPVRWLPKDADYDGYPGRLPSATFRLPAGTTAGYPEEADPAPPEPPRRVEVPDSPPDGGANNANGAKRDKNRRGKARSPEAGRASPEQREPRKKSAANKGETDSGRARDGKKRDSARTRERNKDWAASTDANGGDDRDSRRERGGAGTKSDRRNDRDRRSAETESGERDRSNTDRQGKREIDDRPRRQDADASESDEGAAASTKTPKKDRGGGSRQDGQDRGGRKSGRK